MAIAHEGLASLAVDLHEVGDLLALTNFLVQLHNLVGGSQVTPSDTKLGGEGKFSLAAYA